MLNKRLKNKTGKKKFLFQSPKGMKDVLPFEQPYWEKIRQAANKIADAYSFSRIDTPIAESAEIFERTGEATDLVEKQMYFIKTKGGDKLVLRPEGTAAVMRAYFEHGMSKLSQPTRLFYFGPIFRYEQPQAMRFRQHHQVGFEIIGGENDAIYDAQAILAPFRLMEELKIKNLVIQINSIGCRHCRPVYIKKLQQYYKNNQDKVCVDCRKRLLTRPLRLLDCKNEKCLPIKAEAPIILDYLCSNCRKRLKETLEYLDNLSVFYTVNPYLVRGLDYYNGVIFEIFCGVDLSSNPVVSQQNFPPALASGGRYDYLSEMMGERKVFAVGSSVGVERVVETMKSQGLAGQAKNEAKIFLIHIGEEAKKRDLVILEELRKSGLKALESFGKELLKSQLRAADKGKVKLALISGQKEVFEESVIIRDMGTGNQETVPLNKMVEVIKKKL